MAYGIQINTSTGYQNVLGVNSGRIVKLLTVSSKSGSAVVPEFDSAKGDYFAYQTVGAQSMQPFLWNQATSTISWDRHTSSVSYNAYGSNLEVAFFHYK